MRGRPRREKRTAIRRFAIGGRKAGIRLEPVMWDALADIAKRQGRTVDDILGEIDSSRSMPNRTAAIRAYVVAFYRGPAGGDAPSPDEVGASRKPNR